jgi:small subunit ribosomal protein S17
MADEETKDETTEEAETVEDPVAEAPEAAEPDAVEPEAAAPEAAAPEAVEPEAAEPEDAEPEAAEPVAAEEPVEPPAPAEEPEPAAEEPAAEPARGPRKKRKRLPRAERHKHSKPARVAPTERKAITRTPKPETIPGRRQERRGIVVSDQGDKTIVVRVEMIRAHAKYKKVVRRSSKLHAHDEQNSAGIGDTVRIVETRPLSKTKRWRLAEIVEKAK